MTVPLAHDVVAGPTGSTPILLIGSLGSDRSMWNPQVAPLSAVATVVTADLRGHGETSAPVGPYTVADLGADVLALLDSLGFARIHLVGLSLGGAVSQWISIHHPERVASLTLMCTAAKFGDSANWVSRAETVRRDGVASIAESVIARWFTPALAERDPQLVVRATAMLTGTGDEGYAACCDALSQWDSRADLGRITARTLVIAGADDLATPPEMVSVLADGIEGAHMHVLSPAGHIASIEQAGAVTRMIVDHIGVDVGRDRAHAAGMAVRRAVLGDAHVDRSVAATTAFTEPFQDFITRTAWGDVWNRPGLDHRTRRLLTLAVLVAVGNDHELDMHIRAALRAEMPPEDLVEVFLHTALYAGVPNSNKAFAMAKAALEDGST
ncbi:MAG: 3-oxoadipate enol-lactonase [Rhodococcus sp. (in: high G+C Gram-positive bacteria)]